MSVALQLLRLSRLHRNAQLRTLAVPVRTRSTPKGSGTKAPRRGQTLGGGNERVRTSRGRKSVSRSRRPVEKRKLVLPEIGLTPRQLAALAGVPEPHILRCATELDEEPVHRDAVLPAPVIELITDELRLPLHFLPQTKPLSSTKTDVEQGVRRMPVVTVMGHVDHGKTSLLDALRDGDTANNEVGGITQSVAAFQVPIQNSGKEGDVFATFIDTPGHAAFKSMRANGTVATDIVVLVVAADDGVMPQSIESAKLARAADVPLIIAVNKCDVPGADPERVRYQLLERLGINTEQLGGNVQCVDISAKTRANLPSLLETISLQAEMLDLHSDPSARATGVCLESRVDRSLGSIATVVVRSGTLRTGDFVVFQSPRALSGDLFGKVRSLIDQKSQRLKEAGPGVAVGVVGVREPIPPGADFCVVENERTARAKSHGIIGRNVEAIGTIELANSISKDREEKEAAAKQAAGDASEESSAGAERDVSEEILLAAEGDAVVVRPIVVVIKGDVKGSTDAVSQFVQALGTQQCPIRIVSAGVGDVTEMDVKIVSAARKVKGNKDVPVIIAFNVRVKDSEKRLAARGGVQVLSHNIIYHLEDDLRQRLDKIQQQETIAEVSLGKAAVVRVFESGKIAGCSVQDGALSEGDMAKVWRMPDVSSGSSQRELIFSGAVSSIKHFAKSVKSAQKGMECGIGLEGWSGFEAGDILECVTAKSHGQDS